MMRWLIRANLVGKLMVQRAKLPEVIRKLSHLRYVYTRRAVICLAHAIDESI